MKKERKKESLLANPLERSLPALISFSNFLPIAGLHKVKSIKVVSSLPGKADFLPREQGTYCSEIALHCRVVTNRAHYLQQG